jgi:Domain of unknown function (DUF4136)
MKNAPTVSRSRTRKSVRVRKIFPVLAAIALYLFFSCTSTKILLEETAPGVILSEYKTFNFYSVTTAGDTTPRKADLRMAQLRQSIRRELEEKGYRFTITDPDFLVNAFMKVKQDLQTREKNLVTDPPTYTGQRNYSWQADEMVVGYYKTGLLDIHIIDAKENRLVWESESEGILASRDEDVEKKMAARMKKVFEKFPPSRGRQGAP